MKRFLTSFLMAILLPALSFAQSRIVTGIVADSQGEPLIGAAVVVKDAPSIVAITDLDGRFSIKLPLGSTVLEASFIGMQNQEVNVGSRNSITIVLEDRYNELDEAVVVGYGQQKKASVVGSITQTSGKVLERAGGVSSVGAALTGNLPGVITTASTGMPGEEDPKIYIRGASSWNNSQPLVLVDGIERPISSVDISSVESISVLKDASATSVFGVKGANGVILITTKRGQEGKATVNVGFNSTVKVPSKLPGKYDAYDALMWRNVAIERELGLIPDSWVDITPQSTIDLYRNQTSVEQRERYPNVDWNDELFKDFAMAYNANVSVSGGAKIVNYFAAVDYQYEGDLFKKWDNGRGYDPGYGFNRVNVRSNLDFNITKTTKLHTNLFGSAGIKKGPWGASGSETTVWEGIYGVAPDVFLPRYSDGTWGYYPAASNVSNSAAELALGGIQYTTTTRLNVDFIIEQDLSMLLKGWSAKGIISWDNTFVEKERGVNDEYNDAQYKWIDPDTGETTWKEKFDANNNFDFQDGPQWYVSGGRVSNGSTQRNLFYQFQTDWKRTFGKHDVTAMGMFSRQENAYGSEIPSYREDWAFRATYNYANRYMVELNGAYNGSEKFAPQNRFAFFSSYALGWLISEEKFMKNQNVITFLKLRASYGTIGDDNISSRWLYLSQWAYGGTAKMGLYSENSPYTWYKESTVGNEDVHWEKVTKKNLGLDFSIYDGLVAGSFDLFDDLRTDILIEGSSRAVPPYFGMDAPAANLGKVSSKGFEIELRFNKNIGSDWHLWGNYNFSHAKSTILERDDPALLPDYQKYAGKRLGQNYSYVTDKFYNTWDELYGSTIYSTNDDQKLPGDYNIVDYNGDGVIDSYDSVPYAYSSIPENTYNFTVGFDWKGLSFFVQFYGVYNVTRQVVFTSFYGKRDLLYEQGSFWSKDNTDADIPLPRWVSVASDYSDGNRYMYDGSYLRLKNAEVSYTFAPVWLKRAGVKSLRVFLNGNNLWVWTKMPDDRESNFAGTGWASQGAYPTVKRINLGAKFNF